MATGCPGAELDSHAGAEVSRVMSLLPHAWGSRLASWPLWGLRDCQAPLELRSGQLKQTELRCTNSISLDLLAAERKNSARWCPSQADVPNNPPSTTHPDASFSGDLNGSWQPEEGQAPLP